MIEYFFFLDSTDYLNDEQKKEIGYASLQCYRNWPSIYLNDKHSIRYTKKQSFFFNNFESLKPFKQYNQIAIDGMSGTGKTTLLLQMNRIYGKVNVGSPSTTQTSKYNNDMKRSWVYLEYQFKCKGKHVIWDRSCFSNIIFSIVHFLMAHYKVTTMPKKKKNLPINRILYTNHKNRFHFKLYHKS